MEDYLTNLLSPILDEPQKLEITTTEDERGVLLTVHLHKNDMGRVIGKSGETIKSIRLIMHILGNRHEKLVSVKIAEPI